MRFKSIKIKNYRQYRNLEMVFDKEKPCDIHLIVASNGVGKTNLLNAINWCLYGDEPHTSGGAEGMSMRSRILHIPGMSTTTHCPTAR